MADMPRTEVAECEHQPRSAQDVDFHVGRRVRLRRMLLGMSQEKLGEKLGLTFQQVQKYEKGVNRISASRLFHMAEALDVPIQFFFDDLPRLSKVEPLVAPQREHSILAFFRDRDAIELQKAFDGVSDPDVRKTLVAHVRALAECGSA